MTTLAEYIEGSLRLSGIIGENDSVSAEQGASGLKVFNDLIGWLRGQGIELGIHPQSSTTATLLVPEEDRLGLKYLLAAHLCMDYGRAPSDHVAAMSEMHLTRMLRRAVIAERLGNDAAMPLGEGHRYGSTILNGP